MVSISPTFIYGLLALCSVQAVILLSLIHQHFIVKTKHKNRKKQLDRNKKRYRGAIMSTPLRRFNCFTSPRVNWDERDHLRSLRDLPKSRFATRPCITIIQARRPRPLVFSHIEVYKMVESIARELREAGVRPQTSCAFVLPNGIEGIVYLLALQWIGAVGLPVDPGLEKGLLGGILKTVSALTVVSPYVDEEDREGDELYEKVSGVCEEGGHVHWMINRSVNKGVFMEMCGRRAGQQSAWAGGAGDFKFESTDASFHLPSVHPVAGLAIQISNGEATEIIRLFVDSYRLSEESSTLLILPMHVMHGLLSILSTLSCGGNMVVAGGTSVGREEIVKYVSTLHLNWVTVDSAILGEVYKEVVEGSGVAGRSGLKSLSFIRCVGDVLGGEVLEKMSEVFGCPVLQSYGTTETCGFVTTNTLSENKVGSYGKTVGTTKVRIFSEESRELCTANELGLVGVYTGHADVEHDGHDISKKGDCFVEQGGELFFLTGDKGSVDDEGYLNISTFGSKDTDRVEVVEILEKKMNKQERGVGEGWVEKEASVDGEEGTGAEEEAGDAGGGIGEESRTKEEVVVRTKFFGASGSTGSGSEPGEARNESEGEGDVKEESVQGEDPNDGDVKDEDLNDGDVKDGDVKDGDVKDEDHEDDDPKDDDPKDEDRNDEDLNDEDLKSKDLEDEDPKEEGLQSKDLKSRDLEDEDRTPELSARVSNVQSAAESLCGEGGGSEGASHDSHDSGIRNDSEALSKEASNESGGSNESDSTFAGRSSGSISGSRQGSGSSSTSVTSNALSDGRDDAHEQGEVVIKEEAQGQTPKTSPAKDPAKEGTGSEEARNEVFLLQDIMYRMRKMEQRQHELEDELEEARGLNKVLHRLETVEKKVGEFGAQPASRGEDKSSGQVGTAGIKSGSSLDDFVSRRSDVIEEPVANKGSEEADQEGSEEEVADQEGSEEEGADQEWSEDEVGDKEGSHEEGAKQDIIEEVYDVRNALQIGQASKSTSNESGSSSTPTSSRTASGSSPSSSALPSVSRQLNSNATNTTTSAGDFNPFSSSNDTGASAARSNSAGTTTSISDSDMENMQVHEALQRRVDALEDCVRRLEDGSGDEDMGEEVLSRLSTIEDNQKKLDEGIEQGHRAEMEKMKGLLEHMESSQTKNAAATQRCASEIAAATRALPKRIPADLDVEELARSVRQAAVSASRSSRDTTAAATAAREAADAAKSAATAHAELLRKQAGNESEGSVKKTVVISLNQIERAMLSHPAVAVARAFGVRSGRAGVEAYCVVALKEGARVSEPWLKLHAASKLPPVYVPKEFFHKKGLQPNENRLNLSRDRTLELISDATGYNRSRAVEAPSWSPGAGASQRKK